MSKVINVPQGNSARMIKDAPDSEVSGLYTDGFSSCNIIVGISAKKLILIHVDMLSILDTGKIQKEMRWLSTPSNVIVIYRKEDEAGAIINDLLLTELKEIIPSDKIVNQAVSSKVSSVFLSFESQDSFAVHPNIKFLDNRPQNLILHPQQQQFLAVQKIEEIVGLEARNATKLAYRKKTCVFDGIAWEPMSDHEIKIDMSHDTTKRDMGYFNKNSSQVYIAQQLKCILELLPIKNTFEISGYLYVANHLQNYLNDYKYPEIFKCNFSDTICSGFYPLQTDDDRELHKYLKSILLKSGDVFTEITYALNQYSQKDVGTEFTKNILMEYQQFSGCYKESLACSELYNNYLMQQKNASKTMQAALADYKNKNYKSASDQFLNIIKVFNLTNTKKSPTLASAYYNCGRSLFKDGQYESAQYFLARSLELRKDYTEPMPKDIEIEKTEVALNECKAMQLQSKPRFRLFVG